MRSQPGYVEMTYHSLLPQNNEFVQIYEHDVDGNVIVENPVKIPKDDLFSFFNSYGGYYQFENDIYYPYFFDFVKYEDRAKFYSNQIGSSSQVVEEYLCDIMELCLDNLNSNDLKIAVIIQRNEEMEYIFNRYMASSRYLGLRLYFTEYDNLVSLKLLL